MFKVEFLEAGDDRWSDAFGRLPRDRQDVFYGRPFAELCQRTIYARDRVICASAETPSGPILYPFVLRDLARLVGPPAGDLRDMTGLYGRGGVVCSDQTDLGDLMRFHAAVQEFANEHRVICAFDRFHPVIDNASSAAPGAVIINVGNFIVLDLAPPIETIEANYKYSLRKDLRKAEDKGVRAFVEIGGRHIDTFDAIYGHTMDRNSASQFYYFGKHFLELAVELLGADMFFVFAEASGELVSCELVLLHGMYAHSFIGGTLRDAFPLQPNHILKRELIRELKRRGCGYFLLGAGSRPDDGIERYKRAFAPEGDRPSTVGGKIYDKDAMENLRARMTDASAPMSPGRLQFYDLT